MKLRLKLSGLHPMRHEAPHASIEGGGGDCASGEVVCDLVLQPQQHDEQEVDEGSQRCHLADRGGKNSCAHISTSLTERKVQIAYILHTYTHIHTDPYTPISL
jgi:hypothetical protein